MEKALGLLKNKIGQIDHWNSPQKGEFFFFYR